MENRPIPIIADDRERHSELPALLGDDGRFSLTVQRLTLGDYLLDDRYLVERKRLPDLLASIRSGRLFAQCLRLANQYEYRPIVLLEGHGRELAESRMRWEAVQGALVMIALHMQIPLLRSRSAAETVKTFRYIVAQGRTLGRTVSPRPGQRIHDKRALQRRILQGLPGIGPERAERLLEHFGSVEAVMCADSKALAGVDGLGKQTAKKIRWSVEERAAAYRVS